MICQLCHMGVMKQHPEFMLWYKCETCGWCCPIPADKLSKEGMALARKNLYVRYPIKPRNGHQ